MPESKKIKEISLFILNEFADIVNDTIKNFEREGRIKSPLHREVLKFENTALVFWLFRASNIFPEQLHKYILDEVHDQYYEGLRRRGYEKSAVQAVCNDFNSRYKTYDKLIKNKREFVKIGTSFARAVSSRSNTNIDINEIGIPAILMEKTSAKLEEFRKVVQS